MKRLSFITIFLLSVQLVFSYPITPLPLRKLILRSEYIVIAQVSNPVEIQKPEKWYDKTTGDTVELIRMDVGGDGFADLNIIEVLKGKITSPKITVEYLTGMICPAPANYPDGETVIAFLVKEDTSSTFYSYGLSYGSKLMYSEAALTDYKDRITEYLDILEIKNKRKRKLATVEWLVKCAENKSTRWEGAYELSRTRNLSLYDHSKDEKFAKLLTEKQKVRLEDAFFSTDTIRGNELYLFNFIDESIYLRMRSHLLNNLSFADYYIVPEIMEKIIEVTPNDELSNIYRQVDELRYDDKEKEMKQKVLVNKFIEIASEE